MAADFEVQRVNTAIAPRIPTTVPGYANIVWRARLLIVALAVVAAAVGFATASIMTKVYSARATVLPPRDNSPPGASFSAISLLGSLALGSGGTMAVPGLPPMSSSIASNQDVFLAVLRSRSMRDDVLNAFKETWGPHVESLIVSVDANVSLRPLISLVVEATDPKLAADLANLYFGRMDAMMEKFSHQSLERQQRRFAAQLEQAAQEVQRAEQSLLTFQSQNRVVPSVAGGGANAAGGGQAASAVDAGRSVNLRSAIMGLELQRELLRMKYTEEHPQMREINKQIAEMKKQYAQNLFGSAMELPPVGSGARGSKHEFFVPVEKSTEIQFEFQKLVRNLQIQEGFLTAAIHGLQQIKYGGGTSYPRVEILDPAVPPKDSIRPRIGMITLAATVAGLVLGGLLSFVLEYFRLLKASQRSRRQARGLVVGGDAAKPVSP